LSAPAPANAPPIAIACGGGKFPEAVIASVLRQGRSVFLFLLEGFADPALARYPHVWAKLGSLSKLASAQREHGFTELVLIGDVIRPRISQVGFDWRSLLLLPRAAKIFLGGDDTLLKGAAKIFESYGVRLRGAHEVAPDILMPEGLLTRTKPDAEEMEDIRFGFRLLRAMGPFDVGQAAVIAKRRAVAIEASEGTSAMLLRVADMRLSSRLRLGSREGVLVKAPKANQDRRFDLPAIGLNSVSEAKAAGLAGIAVEAGGSIVTDVEEFAAAANREGLFVVALPRSKTGAS
jgi:DUF1009 family protein